MTELLYLGTLLLFSLLTGGFVWLCDQLGDQLGGKTA